MDSVDQTSPNLSLYSAYIHHCNISAQKPAASLIWGAVLSFIRNEGSGAISLLKRNRLGKVKLKRIGKLWIFYVIFSIM